MLLLFKSNLDKQYLNPTLFSMQQDQVKKHWQQFPPRTPGKDERRAKQISEGYPPEI